ncbi:hypothetical protein D7Z54_05940 [Salibacterium salarium]|uniref:Uncharacterized protein n=1 Tax=Salibacterium salarium TaxID=284579 RepID=A0A3R9WV18_9BACI|nr:hypothetical protein D7Z54_05940 [Salibacterium salarium]
MATIIEAGVPEFIKIIYIHKQNESGSLLNFQNFLNQTILTNYALISSLFLNSLHFTGRPASR